MTFHNTERQPYNQMDLYKLKVRDMDDLLLLSSKSKQYLAHVFGNCQQQITEFKATYANTLLRTCTENYLKILIIVNSLNPEQLAVFLQIHELLNNPTGSISCIDANPGTGKTFLIACILMTYRYSCSYVVYSNKLKYLMDLLYFKGESSTCCKFLMNLFDINYYKAKYYWNTRDLTLEAKCKEIENVVAGIQPYHQVYILDEYSVVSPFLLFFFYCMNKIHKTHIIFLGDHHQLLSMSPTKFHSGDNFSFITSLTSSTFTLQRNVRQENDPTFVQFLNKFMEFFETSNRMTFAVKYFVYEHFPHLFTRANDYNNMFFAQYHIRLKNRLTQYEEYLTTNKIPHTVAWFARGKNCTLKPLAHVRKFRACLLLRLHSCYIYAPNSRISFAVELLEIRSSSLVVKNLENKQTLTIRRIPINTYFVSEQLIDILKEEGLPTLYQYPLKELISTYHAAQGLTLSNITIELDLDCSFINSFFVGLTRIRNISQLHKIHTFDLLSLYYTRSRNDGYYYKINSAVKDLNSIYFALCLNVSSFEKITSRNLKILKCKYSKIPVLDIPNSELITYIKNIQAN